MRATQKEHRRRIKQKVIAAMGGSCRICAYSRCASALEMHHVDPRQKEFSLAQVLNTHRRMDRIIPEMQKCVLLCSNCHKEVHAGIVACPVLPEGGYLFEIPVPRTPSTKICQCGTLIRKNSISCRVCMVRNGRSKKIQWPSPSEMNKLVWQISSTQIGKMLGVTHTSVHRFCKKNNITQLPRNFWKRKNPVDGEESSHRIVCATEGSSSLPDGAARNQTVNW